MKIFPVLIFPHHLDFSMLSPHLFCLWKLQIHNFSILPFLRHSLATLSWYLLEDQIFQRLPSVLAPLSIFHQNKQLISRISTSTKFFFHLRIQISQIQVCSIWISVIKWSLCKKTTLNKFPGKIIWYFWNSFEYYLPCI